MCVLKEPRHLYLLLKLYSIINCLCGFKAGMLSSRTADIPVEHNWFGNAHKQPCYCGFPTGSWLQWLLYIYLCKNPERSSCLQQRWLHPFQGCLRGSSPQSGMPFHYSVITSELSVAVYLLFEFCSIHYLRKQFHFSVKKPSEQPFANFSFVFVW